MPRSCKSTAFVIPHMVSGPDFEFYNCKKRWRRQDVGEGGSDLCPRAPWVSPAKFCAGFARRCESQCRQNWEALPIIRTVTFKYMVETAGSLFVAPFRGRRGSATEDVVQDHSGRRAGAVRQALDGLPALRQSPTTYQRRYDAAALRRGPHGTAKNSSPARSSTKHNIIPGLKGCGRSWGTCIGEPA